MTALQVFGLAVALICAVSLAVVIGSAIVLSGRISRAEEAAEMAAKEQAAKLAELPEERDGRLPA